MSDWLITAVIVWFSISAVLQLVILPARLRAKHIKRETPLWFHAIVSMIFLPLVFVVGLIAYPLQKKKGRRSPQP